MANNTSLITLKTFIKKMINLKYTLLLHITVNYDAHFILKWLVNQSIKLYCIYNGASDAVEILS